MRRLFRELGPTLTLALPITMGQLSQMLMGLTDSVMIGHVGAVPLAASAFAGNVFGVFYVLGIGLMTPVAVFVAHARGAGRPDECGEYLRHGVALGVGFGLMETLLLGVVALRLDWFQQPPEVLAQVHPYFSLIGVSIGPVLVHLAFRQFAEAMGRPWPPMILMLGGVVLNGFLNWVLIYGHLGAPALGLAGAGIATLICRVLVALGLYVWLRRDAQLGPLLPRAWLAPLSRERLREMLRLGVPASGMLLFESGAFAACAVMMGWLGAVPLAAHQIALSCASTTFMFFLGISIAAGMRISAAVGAGESARLRPIGFSAQLLGMAVALVFMLAYLTAARPIARGFVDDPAVIELAAQLLVIVALFQLFDGSQVIGAAVLRGMKDVRIPTAITFLAYWAIAIVGGYLAGFRLGWGPAGIWSALAVGLGLAAILLTLRFRSLTSTACTVAAAPTR